MSTVLDLSDYRAPAPDELVVRRLEPSSHSAQEILALWQAHEDDTVPFLTRRSADELVNFTKSPSHLISISGSRGGGPRKLAGHYALDHRDSVVELGFDRSFAPGIGLQCLAIDTRNFIIGMHFAHSGMYPRRGHSAPRTFPVYASIHEANRISRENYRRSGAVELGSVPQCIRNDGGSGSLVVRGVVFPVFQPSAILAGYERTKARMRSGVYQHRGRKFPIEFQLGGLYNLEAVDAADEEVRYALRKYQLLSMQLDRESIVQRLE